jgi:DNA-binding PadR family transcriptional regulator
VQLGINTSLVLRSRAQLRALFQSAQGLADGVPKLPADLCRQALGLCPQKTLHVVLVFAQSWGVVFVQLLRKTMSTRLVILGLLRERPLYGYEIKHIIEEHMGDWTNIAFGSIYFALKKLSEEGFIEKVGTEQEEGRPSRTIYQITEAGQAEFLHLLREVWREVERHYYATDIGLAFIEALPSEEVKGYLRGRIVQLENTIQHLDEHKKEILALEKIPRKAAAVFAHSQVHFAAELAWTRDLLTEIEQETLS